MKKLVCTFGLGLMLALGMAFAQETGGGSETGGAEQQMAQQMETLDAAFVAAASSGDMYEINSSQLAQERASNEDVLAFAQRMIEDHTRTSEQLTSLAAEANLTLPMALGPIHQFMLAHLTGLEGDAFERAYIEQQVLAHQTAVNLFQAEAEAGQNEALRTFASENLPILQDHLQAVMALMEQLGGNQ